MSQRVVCSRTRAWVVWRDVAGTGGRKGMSIFFRHYVSILLVLLLGASSRSFRIPAGLQNIVLFYFRDNSRTFAATPEHGSCVVLASASPPPGQPRDQNKDQSQHGQSDQEGHGTENLRQRFKQYEHPERKPHLLPPSNLRPDSPGSRQDLLRKPYSAAYHVPPPSGSSFSALRDAVASSSGRTDDRSHSSNDAGGRHTGYLHRSESLRSMGCDSPLHTNPFPLFSRMSSMGEDTTCPAPVEDDLTWDDTDDEFHAASVDESAASGLCADSLQSLSLSRSTGDRFESCSAVGKPSLSSDISRPRHSRKPGTSTGTVSRVSLSKRRSAKKRKRDDSRSTAEYAPWADTTDGRHAAEGRDTIDGPDAPDGRLTAAGGDTGDERLTADGGDTGDGLDSADGTDTVDGPTAPIPECPFNSWVPLPGGTPMTMCGDVDDTDVGPDASLESNEEPVTTKEQSRGLRALRSYEKKRAYFKAYTEQYEEVINEYYGRNVVSFEGDPSGCAKTNIEILVTLVRTETSLFYSASLRDLMHLCVRVLWRAVQLVSVCYPEYSYMVGRNGPTIIRLPHFIRIFEESLEVIARDPGTSTTRQEQLDIAYKVQSAASQGEAAVGALESIVLSGMTTTPSNVVDPLKVHDVLDHLKELPQHTRHLLLMLAELCRCAFEMSEEEAQTFLCQEQPSTGDTARDPKVVESIAYCKGETIKFARVFVEAQVTARKVAEHALRLYKAITLLELVPTDADQQDWL